MNCELNKPLCKRKLMLQSGPFQKKQTCPLSQTPKCPLAMPKCPLLPKTKSSCPLSKENNTNGPMCPLAKPGCPCDPSPPCPLLYDNAPCGENVELATQQNMKTVSKKQVPCPKQYTVYARCPKSIDTAEITQMLTPCGNNLKSDVKQEKAQKDKEPDKSNSTDSSTGSSSTLTTGSDSTTGSNSISTSSSDSSNSIDNKKKPVKKEPRKIQKTGLNVPDCTLSSRRPLPCSQCLGDLLSFKQKSHICKNFDKDCPYVKIMDMCDETCLCDNVACIDTGPPCPFAPPPCPCCATVRCPFSRVPDCPLVAKEPVKQRKPAPCKCYCPVIPPPCSTTIPPGCRMHSNPSNSQPPCPLNPPKCKCDEKKSDNCPLVPNLYSSCPLQPCYQTTTCNNLPPPVECPPPPVKQSKLPCVAVPPNILDSLDDTLKELNKLCTCENPPPPQMVNMVSSVCVPKTKVQPTSCITTKKHDECPLECPCEPPRTFHVPTCPKKNPSCLRSFPKGIKKGEMVCPFSPRCCPLGPKCPFPVAASSEYDPKELPSQNISNQPNSEKMEVKTSIPIKNKTDNPYPTSNCPLNVITSRAKKTPCPFSPGPCPLEPIKPLSIREPKPCPFAPEPPCPLMPKPLCPATPRCLVNPPPPMPECPYAPPGCPLAPKKVCFPDKPMNYDCPCPKPKPCTCLCPCPKPNPCPCPTPDPCCPCPEPDPCCPCPEPDPNCPCPIPEPCCPCPEPDPNCPCPIPEPSCPCPEPDPNCPCPIPEPCCPCPEPDPSPPCPNPDPSCPCPDQNPTDSCPDPNPYPLSVNADLCFPCPPEPDPCPPCPDPDPRCQCSEPNSKCPCSILDKYPKPKAKCPLASKQKCCCTSQTDPNCPVAIEKSKRYYCTSAQRQNSRPSFNQTSASSNKVPKSSNQQPISTYQAPVFNYQPTYPSSTSIHSMPKNCPDTKLGSFRGFPCPPSNIKEITPQTRDVQNITSDMKPFTVETRPSTKDFQLPKTDFQATAEMFQSQQQKNVHPIADMKVIDRLKKTSKELDCALKIPPCEKFPKGRCPMEDLDLCDCAYPCPPCLEPPRCGAASRARPQYCIKPNCCMGLSLPIAVPDKKLNKEEEEEEKIITYYNFTQTKPGREETKYYVEMLDHPPNEFPFGLPKERKNPNWYIIEYGKAFEVCGKFTELAKKRKPHDSAASQFNARDNPMDPETKLVMENRENQARLEREMMQQK